ARAARTGRIRRYLSKHEPQLVAMSGTITSRSIMDYWHLIRACLGEYCPLPLSGHLVRQWAKVIDADNSRAGWTRPDVDYDGSVRTEPIMPLVHWAKRHWPDEDLPETLRGFRRAFKLRLTSAPGVVVTGDAAIGTSLTLHTSPAPMGDSPGIGELHEHIRRVREDWVAPNGDELEH